MQAFVIVIALLAVAALGWALSTTARRLLRRHGVPTDERDVQEPAASVEDGVPEGSDRAGEPAGDDSTGD